MTAKGRLRPARTRDPQRPLSHPKRMFERRELSPSFQQQAAQLLDQRKHPFRDLRMRLDLFSCSQRLRFSWLPGYRYTRQEQQYPKEYDE